jgi:hypothetical protein
MKLIAKVRQIPKSEQKELVQNLKQELLLILKALCTKYKEADFTASS